MQQFKFFSSVEGHLVTRFTSLRMPQGQYIGATRQGKHITWNTEQVVPIPLVEFTRNRREYKRALADGSLKERTEADHEKWQARRDQEDAAALAKTKKVEEAARKAAEPQPPTPAKSEPIPAEGLPNVSTEQQGGTQPSGRARTSKKS